MKNGRRKKRVEAGDWKVFLITAGLLLSGYVFMSSKMIAVGYKIDKVEKVYQELLTVNQNYQAEVMNLCSPGCLKELMRKYGITLEIPPDWSFVDVTVTDERKTAGKRDGEAEANTR